MFCLLRARSSKVPLLDVMLRPAQDSAMAEGWMTTTDVAEKLGVTRQTVARWIRDQRLQATRIRVGKRATYRITRLDFVAFVRRYVEDDIG